MDLSYSNYSNVILKNVLVPTHIFNASRLLRSRYFRTCCVHFVQRSMFYSYVGANVHSNVVSDVRRRLWCRTSGAAPLTGAGQRPWRRGGMDGGTFTRWEKRCRDGGEQTC